MTGKCSKLMVRVSAPQSGSAPRRLGLSLLSSGTDAVLDEPDLEFVYPMPEPTNWCRRAPAATARVQAKRPPPALAVAAVMLPPASHGSGGRRTRLRGASLPAVAVAGAARGSAGGRVARVAAWRRAWPGASRSRRGPRGPRAGLDS